VTTATKHAKHRIKTIKHKEIKGNSNPKKEKTDRNKEKCHP